MIDVRKHPRGAVIQASNAELKNLLNQLQHRLGSNSVWLSKGRIIISHENLGSLLEVVEPSMIFWDKELINIAQCQKSHRDDQMRAQIEVAQVLESPYQNFENYELINKLDPHQVQAVAAITVPSLKGIAIFDEQGTGKTVMALCGFDRLKELGIIDRLLVIAPKSVLGGWEKDGQMLFGNSKYKIKIISGPAQIRRKELVSPHDIIVMSYESVVRDQDFLNMILSAKYRYMLVVDESFYVKNYEAQRTKAVNRLRKVTSRCVVLCGTPAPNSPHDIVEQINIADLGVVFTGKSIPKDKTEAQNLISLYLENAIILRRLKNEVLPDLKNKEIDITSFELQPYQQAIYQRVRDDLILSVRSVDDTQFTRNLKSYLARRSALMQICSHPGAIDPLYDETPAKHLVLDQIMKKYVEEDGEKIVIWSYYRHSLQALAERYAHYGLVKIDGSVRSIEERIEAIRQFQENPNIRIFLGNAAAAGAGITLTAARRAIYESFSNQAAHYMQSVDRIHRRGQKEDVIIHVLLAIDTLEEKEFARIQAKERAGKDLLGDIYEEPITRERFLADLGVSIE